MILVSHKNHTFCFILIGVVKIEFNAYIETLFTQAKLAEELGDEFVWCGVTSDFAEDFPSTGHINLEKVYRHTHFQALVDGLQAFQSLFNQGDVTGIGKIGGILFDNTSIFKEELINAFFNFVDILVVKDGNFNGISW